MKAMISNGPKHNGLLFIFLISLLVPFSIEAKSLNSTSIKDHFMHLERLTNGRLGIYAINTGTGESIAYRANERFPLCSTSKVMGVAAMLKKSEKYPELLDTVIIYAHSDLVFWSPVTKNHVDSGMVLAKLARAAITISDNTAINLLVRQLGGPRAITAFARTIGDHTFRADRFETKLSSAIPGDVRDTSTPKSMVTSLRKLVLGPALGVKQRLLLKTWLIENTTGNNRIRAGTPNKWTVGDKTGTCGYYGTTNDIGIIWPKVGAPIVIAIYYTGKLKHGPPQDLVIAKATRVVLNILNKETNTI